MKASPVVKASHRRAFRRTLTYRRCPNCNQMRLDVLGLTPPSVICRHCGAVSQVDTDFVRIPTLGGYRVVALLQLKAQDFNV